MSDHTNRLPGDRGVGGVVFEINDECDLRGWNDELPAVVERDESTLSGADPLSLFEASDRDAVRAAIGCALGEGGAVVEASFDGFGTWTYEIWFSCHRTDGRATRMTAVATRVDEEARSDHPAADCPSLRGGVQSPSD